MKKHLLDVETSRAVYNNCKPFLQAKMCYNNVFNVVTEYISDFRSGKYKVAYGYMSVFGSVLCRHCFIIGEDDRVIDPTIFVGSTSADREYYSMMIFDDIDKYFEAIESDEYYPALERYLRERNKAAWKWAKTNNKILTG